MKFFVSLIIKGTLASLFVSPLFAIDFVSIGTAGVTGIYFPTGGAICRMVNEHKKEIGIKCSVESTGGSVYNVNMINNNELDLGISQSDTAYQAYNGEGVFQDKPIKSLRSVIAIYPELLAFVVKKDANIKNIADIKGKKINIDVPGSGTRMSSDLVLQAYGIKYDDLSLVNELKSSEGPTILKDNKVDGYFFMVGHPTANIKDAANSVAIDLVAVDRAQIDAIIEAHPYYAAGVISKEFYKGVDHDTLSLGVKAVLVTSENANEEIIYNITKTILDNFEEFKGIHPAYKTITKKSLLEGLSVPQHPGAIRAFQEAGLIEEKK
ncbi:MAG: TAXI family TRAP transporter solute-binding subunit [Campylobacterales bacterium]|nr:TAXI family TRAP transporter solute-binding subunit [Campylobacterales bacterium]